MKPGPARTGGPASGEYGMSGDVETTLRGPEAYKVARKALELMERHAARAAEAQQTA